MRLRRRRALAETRRFWTSGEDSLIRALPLAAGRGEAAGTKRPYVETTALRALAARLGRAPAAVSARRYRLLVADANKPRIVYRITPEARRQWHAFPSMRAEAKRAEPPAFRSRSRPCARCGQTFSTTETRQMLCALCYRGEG